MNAIPYKRYRHSSQPVPHNPNYSQNQSSIECNAPKVLTRFHPFPIVHKIIIIKYLTYSKHGFRRAHFSQMIKSATEMIAEEILRLSMKHQFDSFSYISPREAISKMNSIQI